MNGRILILVVAVLLLLAFPLMAEEGHEAASGQGGVLWGALAAAFAIGIAAFGGAFGQGKAISSACDGMARNPGAAGPIRIALLLGLAFIESLVIYALLIAIIAVGK